MISRILAVFNLSHIDRDLIDLALINGLSGMALSGSGIFGLLAVLSESTFPHGLSGVAFYIAISALSTFIGYVGVCRYAAALGLRIRAALYLVFAIHALGFLGAAFIHPLCLAVSAGAGLGVFFVVFMLKSLNGIDDKARDGYATINGLTQQVATLATPTLGALLLFIGAKLGLDNKFFLTFVTYAVGASVAIPFIRRIPDAPLPYSISLPLKNIFQLRHFPTIGLFLATIGCECLMNPLSILASFILLGQVVEVGWFSAAITVMASLSLYLSHHIRVPGQRWMVFGGSLVGIGLGYLVFNIRFDFPALLFAGAVYALLRVNYFATWFAVSSSVMSREWKEFGRNQALVLGEIFIVCGRLGVAGIVLACDFAGLSMRQSFSFLTGFFILCAVVSLLLARHIDRNST